LVRQNGWKFGLVFVLGISAYCWSGVLEAANVHEEEHSVKWAIILAISGITSVLYSHWNEQRLSEDFKKARQRWEDSLPPAPGKYGP
jgi:hypothetical protein